MTLSNLKEQFSPFLSHSLFQVGLIFLIALMIAQYKRVFLVLIIKRFFKFLPEDIREILVEKNKPVYFLLIFSLICTLGFQFISIDEKWEAFIFPPIKFTFSLAILLFVWALIDIIEDLISDRFKSEDEFIIKNILPYFKKLLKGIFVVIFGLIFLQNIGLNVNSLLASLGIGGLAFALAAKESLSHFFGGVSVILDKPFYVGDWIVCEGVEGVVEDIGFRSTKIKTFYDSVITVPNSQLANFTIDNLGKRTARRTRVTLDLTYDTPPEKIEAFVEGLQSILKSNPCTRKDYYQCYFSGFTSHSLQVFVNFFLKVSDWDEELHQRQNIFLEILRLANKLEVDFAFPTQTLDIPHKPGEKPDAKLELSLEKLKTTAKDFGPQGKLAKPQGLGLFDPSKN